MTVTKEFAEKVKKLNRLEEEARNLRKEIEEEFDNLAGDSCYYEDIGITKTPTGKKQEDDGTEYCDQSTGYCEDDYYGTYYYRIDDSKEFVYYKYHC